MQANTETINRTGIKTLDKIADIPVVNSAITNVSGYYEQIKDKNVLLRTGCNLAELSFQTMKFASTPITNMCSKKIETVDTFLSGKVESIGNAYPAINQPTEKMTTAAYDIYDKTNTMIKNPSETLTSLKDLTVQTASTCGNKVLETCLENRYSKVVAEPVLNFTEKSLNYYLPSTMTETTDKNTVQRLYDINKRVYNHVYDQTFTKLTNLHNQFQQTIEKMISLKKLVEEIYTKRKNQVIDTVLENSLVKKCQVYMETNNISMARLEEIARGYFKSILTEVTDLFEKYMYLVEKFPISLNFNKLKENLLSLKDSINKESLSAYLTKSIDYCKDLNQSLISYTNNIFKSSIEESKPVVTTPSVTEPIVTKPSVTEPVVTKPSVTEPVVTKPVVTKPIVTEPVVTKPNVTEPVVTKPKPVSVGMIPTKPV